MGIGLFSFASSTVGVPPSTQRAAGSGLLFIE
jgi:hypothetical protein